MHQSTHLFARPVPPNALPCQLACRVHQRQEAVVVQRVVFHEVNDVKLVAAAWCRCVGWRCGGALLASATPARWQYTCFTHARVRLARHRLLSQQIPAITSTGNKNLNMHWVLGLPTCTGCWVSQHALGVACLNRQCGCIVNCCGQLLRDAAWQGLNGQLQRRCACVQVHDEPRKASSRYNWVQELGKHSLSPSDLPVV
eukprot:366421-Chlamydomonas_euryale.AAC.20